MSAGQNQSSRTSDDGIAWPIFVISLCGAAERRARCKAALDRLGLKFEFFDALKGSDLSDEKVAGVYDRKKNLNCFKRPLSRPEIGCYLSHYSLWDRIGKCGDAGAIVLEDDFEADDALPAILKDICRLDLTNCLVKLDSQRRVGGALLASLACGRELRAPRKVPGLALGYVIEHRAAASLSKKALPFGRPVDMDLKHWWNFGIAVLVVQPPVVRNRLTEDPSAIEASRESMKPAGYLSGFVRLGRNLHYQMLYELQLLRARSKSQLTSQKVKSADTVDR